MLIIPQEPPEELLRAVPVAALLQTASNHRTMEQGLPLAWLGAVGQLLYLSLSLQVWFGCEQLWALEELST